MNIFNIARAFKHMKERKWSHIFWAIDVHDTICESNYERGVVNRKFYPCAKEVLQQLTESTDIKLILFTCSHRDDIEHILNWLKQNNILFDYVNENPECTSNKISNFEHKMYFNVLLDDKAGFEATDWKTIKQEMIRLKRWKF